jgi:hypothetical protein
VSAAGGNDGDAVGSLQADLLGPHSHRFKVHAEPRGSGGGFSAVDGPEDANPTPVASDGSGIGPETRPKDVYVNKIIKHWG